MVDRLEARWETSSNGGDLVGTKGPRLDGLDDHLIGKWRCVC